jgi:hypothetical protein
MTDAPGTYYHLSVDETLPHWASKYKQWGWLYETLDRIRDTNRVCVLTAHDKREVARILSAVSITYPRVRKSIKPHCRTHKNEKGIEIAIWFGAKEDE